MVAWSSSSDHRDRGVDTVSRGCHVSSSSCREAGPVTEASASKAAAVVAEAALPITATAAQGSDTAVWGTPARAVPPPGHIVITQVICMTEGEHC